MNKVRDAGTKHSKTRIARINNNNTPCQPQQFKMRILHWVFALLWIPNATSDQTRFKELSKQDSNKEVPSLSLFIPPPQLVSIVSDGVKTITAPKPVRQNLIVDPLLALLNEEEAQLLQFLLPAIFPNKTSDSKIEQRHPSSESAERLAQVLTTTKTTTTLDPVVNWLFHGPSDDVVTQPPTPGPIISVSDDMLITMLQQAVSNFSPTSTVASTTETVRFTGPVAIGDDLLATLLKTLKDQTDKPVDAFEDLLAISDGVALTTPSLFDSLTTDASDLQWPDNVKPGGGISDEAIAAIISDVNKINNNISEAVGVPDLSGDFLGDKPVTISDDHIAQLIHDMEIAVNTSTMQSDEIKDEKSNVTKTSEKSNIRITKGKKAANLKNSGSNKRGSKNPNRLRKKPGRKPTRLAKPNLWERLVKAASSAIFGEKKPQKGLFQVDDILDLLTNL